MYVHVRRVRTARPTNGPTQCNNATATAPHHGNHQHSQTRARQYNTPRPCSYTNSRVRAGRARPSTAYTSMRISLVVALLGASVAGCAGLSSSPLGLGLYLRFSPLIGGPHFAPVHVEVMLADESTGTLHRFDFVPADATDPTTLAMLLSLRSVPGILRYRVVKGSSSSALPVVADDNDEDAISSPGELRTILATTSKDGGNIIRGENGITFRLASFEPSGDSSALISEAENFTKQYQLNRGKLNLLTNSCFTYAYELLQFIDKRR